MHILLILECAVCVCCLAYLFLAGAVGAVKRTWAVILCGCVLLAAMGFLIYQLQQARLNRSNFERDSLLLAMQKAYPTAIMLNLTRNTYRYFPSADFVTRPMPRTGSYTVLVDQTAPDVYSAYRDAFYDFFSRQALMERFAQGETTLSFEQRHLGTDHLYHWVIQYVYKVDSPYSSDVQAILLARNNDEARADAEKLRVALEDKDRELTDVYSSLTNGIVKVAKRKDYPVIFANPAFYSMIGYTKEQFEDECYGYLSYITFAQDGREGGKGFEALSPGMYTSGRYRIVRRDGGLLWVRYDATINVLEENVYYVMFTDISAAVQNEQRLMEQQYYRDLADVRVSGCTVIYPVKGNGEPLYVGGNIYSLFGYTPEEFKLLCREKYQSFVYAEDYAFVLARQDEALAQNLERFQIEFRVHRKDGKVIWVMNQASRAAGYDGELVYVCMYIDVTVQHMREDEAISKMERDALTGVLIRTAFEADVSALLQQPDDGRQHALIMLDIDDFKRINDSQGHCAGDEALRAIVGALHKTLRSDDLIGRLGGDEFMVLIRDIRDAQTLADRCSTLCSNIADVSVGGHHVTASIGAICFTTGDAATSFNALYACMDTAMYEAKRNGKNGYCIYSEALYNNWQL
ncbi:MAG: diguanylate cyclase [Clostridia bacterium]|nr:diguanylate cyclase [Clostridia bacterium]